MCVSVLPSAWLANPRYWRRGAGSRPSARRAGAVALAASVSFAAVVGWQQLSHGNADSAVADRGVPVASVQSAQEHDDLYLAAHQEMTADQSVVKVAYGNGVRH
jgi:sigma-E factor negative regulatory protein RseA